MCVHCTRACACVSVCVCAQCNIKTVPNTTKFVIEIVRSLNSTQPSPPNHPVYMSLHSRWLSFACVLRRFYERPFWTRVNEKRARAAYAVSRNRTHKCCITMIVLYVRIGQHK